MQSLNPNVERLVVQPGQDGLAQILSYLNERGSFDAIHILGHGSAGVQRLGTAELSLQRLQGGLSELAQQLQQLSHYLRPDADLLLYGCDVASGDGGQLLVKEIGKLTGADIAWLVPHQANKRIIDATANRMGLSPEKVMLNIQRYGNTTAATIPLCLWEWRQQLNKGDLIVLAAFGGGFTWGATLVKWEY